VRYLTKRYLRSRTASLHDDIEQRVPMAHSGIAYHCR